MKRPCKEPERKERSPAKARVSMTTKVSVATMEDRKQRNQVFVILKESIGEPRNVSPAKLK